MIVIIVHTNNKNNVCRSVQLRARQPQKFQKDIDEQKKQKVPLGFRGLPHWLIRRRRQIILRRQNNSSSKK